MVVWGIARVVAMLMCWQLRKGSIPTAVATVTSLCQPQLPKGLGDVSHSESGNVPVEESRAIATATIQNIVAIWNSSAATPQAVFQDTFT